jgi:predicted RNase H-like nuclease (RuvC/YqgF family)
VNFGAFLPSYIIAGIDPGATFGIAILSLSGKKLALHSTNEGMAEAVRIIERHGTPSLIACDVSPLPDAALRIASYFSCKAFAPAREIRELEKNSIAEGAGVRNNHERDSYAAAVLAYRSHANKLRQIDSLPEVSGDEKERIKHLILRGYRLKDAFLALKEPEEGKEKPAEQKKEGQRAFSSEELRARASELARENANLRLMVMRLEGEKSQLGERLRLLENGVRQSLLRDSELRNLRFQLQKVSERLQHGKKLQPREKQHPRQPQKEQRKNSQMPPKDNLNKLGSPKVDIEKMVTDYRRGRKQI